MLAVDAALAVERRLCWEGWVRRLVELVVEEVVKGSWGGSLLEGGIVAVLCVLDV